MREKCSIIVGTILYMKIIGINCLDSHILKIMKDVIRINVHQVVQRTSYSFQQCRAHNYNSIQQCGS